MARPSLRPLFVSLAAAGAFGALTSPVLAQEPTREVRVDPDAYPPPQTRLPVLAAGALLTGAFYGGAVGASYLWPDARGAEDLRIPVVGPWMKLFQTGCSDTAPSCNQFLIAIGAVLAGLDGLGQAGGIGLLLEGIFMPTRPSAATTFGVPGTVGSLRLSPGGASSTPFARDGLTPTPSWRSVSWHPVPFAAGADGVGLGVAGTF
jgi:hypothetical protein